jgi:hypothetical protein
MKLLLLAFVLAALQSDTTALVEASKDAKSKRKTITTKVITNADVKKSKGKVAQKAGTPPPAAEAKPEPTSLEKQAMDRAARQIAEARLATAQKHVTELERELAAIETSYYETNDLDYRDKVLTKRFADVKARLDQAKKELSASSSQLSGSAGKTPES